MSAISGTFLIVQGSLVKSAAHSIGSAAFFEPLILTDPLSGFPPLTKNLFMADELYRRNFFNST